MKINDVLECINRALEDERRAKGIEAIGHFVCHSNYAKRIGTIKEFQTFIDFVNYKTGCSHRVTSYFHVENCLQDKVEEIKERIALKVLKEFFLLLRTGVGIYSYEKFLNGTFDGRT